MLAYIRKHKMRSVVFGGIILCIIAMALTKTLSYPYILIDRQIELSKYCGGTGIEQFDAKSFGFHIVGPTGFCILPHRIFPDDGSIQIIPTGKYSVINEYAKGSITQASQATILFEKTEIGRSPKELVEKMQNGGFLNDAIISEYTNAQNLHIMVLKNTTGIDPTRRYDWAFVLHPNGTVLLSLLTAHPETPEVFNYILDNLSVID